MHYPLLYGKLKAGLPFLERSVSTSKYNPHRPVRIVRLWWERLDWPAMRRPDGRSLILRLDLPRPPGFPASIPWHPHDLEVRWLGTIASTPYVVLECLPLDLDDGIDQYVARLLPPTMTEGGMVDEGIEEGEADWRIRHGAHRPLIVPIDEAELSHIEFELRTAVDAHPRLQESDLASLRPSDVTPDLGVGDYVRNPPSEPPQPTPEPLRAIWTWPGPLGPVPIPEEGSDAYYDACVQERRLKWGANYLSVRPGGWEVNGRDTEAIVLRVARPSAQDLTLTLGQASDPDARLELTVREHVAHAGQHYLVLAVPEHQSAVELRDLQLVRVEPGRVTIVDQDEHRQVLRLLIDRLEEGRRGRAFRPLALTPGSGLQEALRLLDRPPARQGPTARARVDAPPPPDRADIPPPPNPADFPPAPGRADEPSSTYGGGDTMFFCRHCGNPVPASHAYCGYCGAPMS